MLFQLSVKTKDMKLITVPEKFLASKGVKNSRIYVYAGIGIVIGIAGYILYRRIKRNTDARWDSGSTQARLEEQLDNLDVQGATLTSGEAIIISQNLLNAMDRWGTDEEAIIDNLSQCKNAEDLNLVIQTFGIKPYDGTGLADTFLSRQIAGVMKNLNGWLREELSGSSLREVKTIFTNLDVPF
jgi:hypothetical protein